MKSPLGVSDTTEIHISSIFGVGVLLPYTFLPRALWLYPVSMARFLARDSRLSKCAPAMCMAAVSSRCRVVHKPKYDMHHPSLTSLLLVDVKVQEAEAANQPDRKRLTTTDRRLDEATVRCACA